METAYTFDDVMFEPQYSDILSRTEVDLTSDIGGLKLKLPLISANMADITEERMAVSMHMEGGLGILHRFMSIADNVEMFLNLSKEISRDKIGVSVGVGSKEKDRFCALFEAGARIFCIDVAHGHHAHVKDMLIWARLTYFDEPFIIAGNIASAKAAIDLASWGASAVKVGVGPGSCCSTRESTGVGIPQLSLLKSIREAYSTLRITVGIIADGGIKKTGDIAKALKYADAVMMGGFFAGTSETPGHVYKGMDKQYYKTMAGSASAENKVKHGKANEFVEGCIRTVPFRGHVKYILRNAKENVQSAFSYAGARNVKEFRKKSVLVKISGGGKKESKF